MAAVITVLHVIACVFLIAVVLLQRGKGAQIGAVFGGGAGATLFGSRGAGNFLTKLTAIAATVFMLTSLSLSYFGMTSGGERLFEKGTTGEEPKKDSLFEEVGKAPAQERGAAAPDANAAPAADAKPDAAPADSGAPPAPAPDKG